MGRNFVPVSEHCAQRAQVTLKITFLVELINGDRLTVELDFSVMFQALEEICSRPFC